MDLKIKYNILSTERYSIYRSRALDHLPDYAEEREERPRSYTNCDGKFHGVTDQPFHQHHPLLWRDNAHPTAYGSYYIRLDGLVMVTSPLVTSLGEIRPGKGFLLSGMQQPPPDYQLLGEMGFQMHIILIVKMSAIVLVKRRCLYFFCRICPLIGRIVSTLQGAVIHPITRKQNYSQQITIMHSSNQYYMGGICNLSSDGSVKISIPALAKVCYLDAQYASASF